MIKRSIIQIILLLGIVVPVNAQDTLSFSTPTITGIGQYSLNSGLASTDLNEVFIDRRGRMWVNPNVITARQFRLSFFQYDGTQSIFYDLKPEWLSEESKTPTWFILGETQQGFLYGSNRLHNILFYWHRNDCRGYKISILLVKVHKLWHATDLQRKAMSAGTSKNLCEADWNSQIPLHGDYFIDINQRAADFILTCSLTN